jgi:hypothetical protein
VVDGFLLKIGGRKIYLGKFFMDFLLTQVNMKIIDERLDTRLHAYAQPDTQKLIFSPEPDWATLAYWEIVFFGQLFENYRSSRNFWATYFQC